MKRECGHEWFHADCKECVAYVLTQRGVPRQKAEELVTHPRPSAETDSPERKMYKIDVLKNACVYRGPKIPPEAGCGCGTAPVYKCEKFEKCGILDGGPKKLQTCLDCPQRKTYKDIRETPNVGVVIGTYGLPNLAALQICLIRKHCGDVPILITDDCSDGTGITPIEDSNFGKLCKLARDNKDVIVWSNPTRFGHAGGDLTTYFVGLQWAAVKNIDVLCKLSQRCLIDIPNWLQDGAMSLWKTGMSTSSQKCREGNSFFDIRSEAMLMNVDKWNIPTILDHLRARRLSPEDGRPGVAAEAVLWDTIRDRLDGKLHPWSIMGEDRMTKYPGLIWHCSHTKEEYKALFEREGLEMDKDFTCKGWIHLPGYQW